MPLPGGCVPVPCVGVAVGQGAADGVSRSAGHTGAQLAQHHGADMGENHAGLSLGSGFWHCVTGSGEVLANPVGISSSSSSPKACPQAATPACEGLGRALAGAGDRHNLQRARLSLAAGVIAAWPWLSPWAQAGDLEEPWQVSSWVVTISGCLWWGRAGLGLWG